MFLHACAIICLVLEARERRGSCLLERSDDVPVAKMKIIDVARNHKQGESKILGGLQ